LSKAVGRDLRLGSLHELRAQLPKSAVQEAQV
jgi:hypothetical protein